MDLPVIEYLRWFRTLGRDAEFDLTFSGMPNVPLETFGLRPDELLPDDPLAWGSPTLRAALAETLELPEANLLPVCGSTMGILVVCMALLSRGDTVVVEEPAYEPLRAIPSVTGATLRRFPRGFRERFRLDREAFLQATGDSPRLVVLTDPHNPSGVRLSMEDRVWLARTAEERGFDILIDEVYLDFRPAGPVLHAQQHGDRLISVSSLTKVYGLSRIRVGWIAARDEFIASAMPVFDYTIGDLAAPTVALGAAACRKLPSIGAAHRKIADENRALVADWIGGRPELDWVEPDLGIVGFPRLASGDDAGKLYEAARKIGVLIVPGKFFEVPAAFRIGWGIERARLEGALDRLGKVLDTIG